MPVTRSHKSVPATNMPPAPTAVPQASGAQSSTLSTGDESATITASTTDATVETVTGRTDTSYGSNTTETTTTTSNTAATTKSPQETSTEKKKMKSKSSHGRRRELLKAKQELLQKQIELAAARVAYLEETDTDEDLESEEATVREERTKNWVNTSILALTHEPHNEDIDTTPRDPVKRDEPTMSPRTGGIPPREMMQTAKLVTSMPAERQPEATEAAIRNVTSQVVTQQEVQPPARYETEAPSKQFDYNELAAAITLAARAIQPAVVQQRSVPELPMFNGSSSDWLPFKIAYEESAVHLTEQENLARLRRSLRGAAREAVQCLFVGATNSQEVLNLLSSRFGRPDALVMAEMNKLRALPRLSENPRDICIFASKVQNITATVKALNKLHYLYNAEVVRGVVEKLPATLRYRYYDFAAEVPDEQPDLITLATFLARTAERCGSFAPIEAIHTEDRRESQNIRRAVQKTYHHKENEDEHRTFTKPPPCPVCNRENHSTPECATFKNAERTARWELAKSHKLCFRCLRVRKFRHSCKPKTCNIDGCEYKHHPLLHSTYTPPVRNEKTTHTQDTSQCDVATVTSTFEAKKTTKALLKIIPVQLRGPAGAHETYALLDDGSTCTLIESAIASKIGATGPPEPFSIEGVAGARVNATTSARVRFTIRGRGTDSFDITARTMQGLKLSPQGVSHQAIVACSHLRDIREQLMYERATPTVLIGQDNWHLLLTHEVRRGDNTQPVASLTDLGWVLHGTSTLTPQRQVHIVNHFITKEENDSMEDLMKQHFALEALGVEAKRSYNDEERRALRILDDTTKRLPAGGFETGLLWKTDDQYVPESFDTAMKRLEHLEKKLDRDEAMKSRYIQQLRTLFENGYAEPAPATKSERVWYLPHFAVINPQKPEKLRIVHDAAARCRGVSLNDMLLSGPDLLQSLTGVLMKFRQRPIAVTADIKDMFMRVDIIEEDRDMQRFLWRDERRTGPPTEYRMKSVIFGATSSPSTAIYIKNKNAEHFKEKYPEAATAIVENHYVDDYLASFDNEEDAERISQQVAYVHSRGNFFLQRWASNSRRVRATLAPGESENVVQMNKEKILGMIWQTESDTLSFNVNHHKIPADIIEGQRTPTKREALRVAMSIYDPLGVATPVTIQAKRIMQDTWRSGIDWDAALQPNEDAAWKKWMEHVRRLSQLSVPRCYPTLTSARDVQLHTFVDASTSAYVAAVYWRVTDAEGHVHISLIAGKGRVAPLKTVSIPRLELQAAVLGCRLAQTAVEQHDVKPTRRFYWSDSRTVLTWVRTGPRAYKPFVAHRVAEIAETTKTCEWRWVPTKLNVADDATRDTPSDFSSEHRWYKGPDFLYTPENEWPSEKEDNPTACENTGEERVHLITATPRLSEALPDITRFSSWLRVIRTTARVLQFINKIRRKERCGVTCKRTRKNKEKDPVWQKGATQNTQTQLKSNTPAARVAPTYAPLAAHYLHAAKLLWVRALQQQLFPSEVEALQRGAPLPAASRLSQLSVVLDNEGVIRLRSRVAAAADITHTQREPAIIDGTHTWTRLYIAWVHTSLHHGGFETTTNEVRQEYWVLRLRYAVRSTIKQCQACRIRKAKPAQPSTGNHPRSRLAHHQRPFTFTGLDYFGPMIVTVGRSHKKRYGVLFTCLTTRAVHLEIAESLTTDSAIMALRRFVNRRGCPTELWSDQGTNLRGADIEMRRAVEEGLREEASIRFITWKYIPPSAPFMGGAWERLVRSVKTSLAVILHERAPKEEVLATLLVEVENIVNSRPLTHVSTSAEDDEALTPNHFLLGGPSRVPQPGTFTDGDTAGRRDWRVSQRLADMFWSRWVREYLPDLQHRREPHARGAIKLNDLVLIADGTLPRNMWPRGVVIATYPGPDGEVRAVDVRTRKGVLRRPTKKLAILEIEPETCTSSQRTPQ